MTRLPGLSAYRALARRTKEETAPTLSPRPEGELIWFHVGDPGNMLAVQDLALRIAALRPDLNVLFTVPDDSGPSTLPLPERAGILQITVPEDHPVAVQRFLDHWQPDTCIWVWGGLRPLLVQETAARACPMYLIDADPRGLEKTGNRWRPDKVRSLVAPFAASFARSASGKKRLLQLGLSDERVFQTPPLLAGGQVLGYAETDLADLSDAMKGRPAWYATQLTRDEVPVVLAAHKQALRLSHRLLLVLQPKDPDDADHVVAQAADRDLTTIRWDDGQYPDDNTPLMISADAVDRGLFYRVAPVCFMGTTLSGADGGCDPLEPAALGSAILYGPKVRHFMSSYSRLASAGAARIVNDTGALGTAVSRLIAPDQAATMAHAGWEVISEGALQADQVIELVQNALDQRQRVL
ncbi:3-deoxy-D-manno-octulosonic-acid transferase [Sulfitobacter noctilucae]|uniref:3-deoxy-D-manno-octulosonic acid transferase n=1 Tax=Sulfitobacter noctilucae TaxID=1342302 RepID=UPI00046A1BA4|nr:glycosyltransferase N-terminal domain-containing protein [Sulfitobacter noctilucae]KIN75299.1 3-deoxy-D-manno-octulosonic-acid transferase [Sulfitobacter noctilucae]